MDMKTAEAGLAAPAISEAAPGPVAASLPERAVEPTVFAIIAGVSVCHAMNDLIQSLVPAIYPLLKTSYGLDFGQVGLITLTFQLTASLLQPFVGLYTDRRPQPFSLVAGMAASLVGLLLLAWANSFGGILAGAALVGVGSSVFHPEASRVARLASGGRHGLAQALFQVGGNFGQAAGPLLAAFIVVPNGQGSVAWCSAAALVAIGVMFVVGRWYRAKLAAPRRAATAVPATGLSRRRVGFAVALLVVLVFSKNVYTASINSYYTFYLIDRFHLPVQTAQVYLFVFLGSVALGTVIGGPFIDRFGRRAVIRASVLGVLPFTLALPFANEAWTVALTVPIGLILACSLPAILIFALELMPGRVGMVSGLFFGLSFGMGGLGAAVLGEIADHSSIDFVYRLCAWLPAIGVVALFLPNVGVRRPA